MLNSQRGVLLVIGIPSATYLGLFWLLLPALFYAAAGERGFGPAVMLALMATVTLGWVAGAIIVGLGAAWILRKVSLSELATICVIAFYGLIATFAGIIGQAALVYPIFSR